VPTKADPPNLSAIFEKAAATPIEGHDSEWIWLTEDILKLSLIHIPAVQEALRQGRWRNAKNQKAYIKTVAKRVAAKMKLLDDPTENSHLEIPNLVDDDGRPLGHHAYIDHRSYAGPVKEGSGWREGSNSDVRDFDEYTENGEWLNAKLRWPSSKLNFHIPQLGITPADVRRNAMKRFEALSYFYTRYTFQITKWKGHVKPISDFQIAIEKCILRRFRGGAESLGYSFHRNVHLVVFDRSGRIKAFS
jgi:hypothetical protein